MYIYIERERVGKRYIVYPDYKCWREKKKKLKIKASMRDRKETDKRKKERKRVDCPNFIYSPQFTRVIFPLSHAKTCALLSAAKNTSAAK